MQKLSEKHPITGAILGVVDPSLDAVESAKELINGNFTAAGIAATNAACKGKCNVVEVLIPDKVADAVKNALGRNKPQGNGTLTTDGSNNALADIRNSRRAPTENQTLDTSQTDREFFNNLQRSKDVGQSKPRTFWQKVLEFGRALIDDGNKLTPKD